MFQQLFNWKTGLALIAICIVTGTIFYSAYLAKKIEKEEKKKVTEWVQASNSLLNPRDTSNTDLAFTIIQNNTDIPIIATNEKDSIMEYINIDSSKASKKDFLKNTLSKLKSLNDPIVWKDPFHPEKFNRYYYGHTNLLNEVRYYPFVQLFIVGLFIVVTVLALRSSYRSTQNQVWAGMAKETAHQLGTPVSSLEGWLEMLKAKPGNERMVKELEKDISRLRLVSDRFGKIGSTPHLEMTNLVQQINNMIDYIRKRATDKVIFFIDTHGEQKITAQISAPLFDWVIENLLKNALDAMEGKGTIRIDIQNSTNTVTLDVTDTGKGITRQNISKVFKPGFTTKKRGWGLGLSLSKRIIEQYHKGELFVKNSEPGKGTTFRIVLKK
ncbi:MAG: HAMP domain-containing histidine kinase [Bacteroidetes bacterium]|nr:HAMP domain-containing histidine kinase [Bacteroidota bacterium]MBS1930737.1 HAMP domain-containing histidine kinase [Bacteroidota bacterium]